MSVRVGDRFQANEGHCPGKASIVRWVSLPVQHAPWKGLVLVLVVGATAAAVYLGTGSPGWTLLSVILLLAGVHDFLLPTTYRLSEEGVSSRILWYRRHKPWSSCRSCWVDAHGVLLSPFPERSRLESHRGLYLRFAGSDRQAVVRFVQDKINRQTESRA